MTTEMPHFNAGIPEGGYGVPEPEDEVPREGAGADAGPDGTGTDTGSP
ncbi:hypothetical protein ACQCSX_02850 [Pseudarthrobacter sp. P1]